MGCADSLQDAQLIREWAGGLVLLLPRHHQHPSSATLQPEGHPGEKPVPQGMGRAGGPQQPSWPLAAQSAVAMDTAEVLGPFLPWQLPGLYLLILGDGHGSLPGLQQLQSLHV